MPSVQCYKNSLSQQCCKSLLNHRMSMLRKLSCSLKPCVTGGDESPACPCPSHTKEAWARLFTDLLTVLAALWDGRGAYFIPEKNCRLSHPPSLTMLHVLVCGFMQQCAACLLPGAAEPVPCQSPYHHLEP